eukprot:6177380-Pleurochrysis_carterae.AAC.1
MMTERVQLPKFARTSRKLSCARNRNRSLFLSFGLLCRALLSGSTPAQTPHPPLPKTAPVTPPLVHLHDGCACAERRGAKKMREASAPRAVHQPRSGPGSSATPE